MNPKIQLTRLQNIGWSLWDPIGLLGEGERWEDQPYQDEYDSYLIEAAAQIRRSVDKNQVVEYLVKIETKHMGLGPIHLSAKKRAHAVVDAIEADNQLWK